MRWMYLFIFHRTLSLDWIFDTAGHRASSVYFRIYQCFDFIIMSAENSTLHKYIV